jgi:hypothetical protein
MTVLRAVILFSGLRPTAPCAQTQTNKNHESVAKQRFHDFCYGSFDW